MVTMVRRQGKGVKVPRLNIKKERVMQTWWQRKDNVRDKRITTQSMEAKGKPSKKTRDSQARGDWILKP